MFKFITAFGANSFSVAGLFQDVQQRLSELMAKVDRVIVEALKGFE